MDVDTAQRLRSLMVVPRWTIVPTIRSQNVGEHSFHVAWVALWLNQFALTPYTQGVLLEEAIMHDGEESVTGDVPSNFKSFVKGAINGFLINRGMYSKASVGLRQFVKLADIIEALIFIREEELLGNRRLDKIRTELLSKLSDVASNVKWDITAWHKYREENGGKHDGIYNCEHPWQFLLTDGFIKSTVGMDQI